MKAFTITTPLLITLMSLIQPCPAPPLAALGGIIGLGVEEGAAVAAGAEAADIAGLAANDAGYALAAKRSRFDTRSSSDTFTTCIADTPGAASNARLIVGTDTINMNGTANSWALINGVPPSCMAQVSLYNQNPNIAQLNAIHGRTVIFNNTAVLLTGIPNGYMTYLHTLVKA
jgi:hypothetical protein